MNYRPPGGGLYYERPVLFFNDGSPEMFFSRGFLMNNPEASSRRPPSVPTLTELQSHALDAVHFASCKLALTHKWTTGDLCFFNNRKLLHARQGFQNGKTQTEGIRHILRLWLADVEYAKAPPVILQPRWNKIFAPRENIKGEKKHDPEDLKWPLEPIV